MASMLGGAVPEMCQRQARQALSMSARKRFERDVVEEKA